MRATPMVQVTCDQCDIAQIEVTLLETARGHYKDRNVDAALADAGWLVLDDLDICPSCVESGDLLGRQSRAVQAEAWHPLEGGREGIADQKQLLAQVWIEGANLSLPPIAAAYAALAQKVKGAAGH